MGYRVSINEGFTNVWLPDGNDHQAGDVVDLTDAEFARLDDPAFVARVLTVIDDGIADPNRSAYPLVTSVSEAAPLIQELDQRVTTLEGIVL